MLEQQEIKRNPDGTLIRGSASLNPNGRPKGKTLKEFAREYLASLPDEEKLEYLSKLPKEIVWKMAEGNPKQETDAKVEGSLTVIVPQAVAKSFNIQPHGQETERIFTDTETRGDDSQ
jgi:predicted phosphoadenosine phosphosulfate sulfurtransferase